MAFADINLMLSRGKSSFQNTSKQWLWEEFTKASKPEPPSLQRLIQMQDAYHEGAHLSLPDPCRARMPTSSQHRNLLFSRVLPFRQTSLLQLQNFEVLWHHAKPLTALYLNISCLPPSPPKLLLPEGKPQSDRKDKEGEGHATLAFKQWCHTIS